MLIYPSICCVRSMKRSILGISSSVATLLLVSGCSVDKINKILNLQPPQPPQPPQPKQQKIIRVWRGNEYDVTSKSVCGIYTSPSEISKFQSEGWLIKASNPINYRLEQRFHYVNCQGSEVVLEK